MNAETKAFASCVSTCDAWKNAMEANAGELLRLGFQLRDGVAAKNGGLGVDRAERPHEAGKVRRRAGEENDLRIGELDDAGVRAPLVHVGEVRVLLENNTTAGAERLGKRGTPAAAVGVVAVHDRCPLEP
jgi:hypothetical protein